MIVKKERSQIAPRQPPVLDAMAYVCECGKKWFLTRNEADSQETRTFRCACGRTIVIESGIVYSTGYPRYGFRKRAA